jgi:hypothetical protein
MNKQENQVDAKVPAKIKPKIDPPKVADRVLPFDDGSKRKK